MEEKLLKIIEHYGINNQQRKLQEEVFELQEAITKFENGIGDIKHVVEELVDVTVLLDQFRVFYEIYQDEESEMYDFKVNRQLERIEKE